jgi:hypothetical protein
MMQTALCYAAAGYQDRALAIFQRELKPAIVTGWIAEVQAERSAAAAALDRAAGTGSPARRLTRQEIERLVNGLGGLLAVLGETDPTDKAEVNRRLGLKLTYDHETESIMTEATPRSSVDVVSVSEGGH